MAKRKKSNKQVTKKGILVAWVAMFAIIGGYLIYRSFAYTETGRTGVVNLTDGAFKQDNNPSTGTKGDASVTYDQNLGLELRTFGENSVAVAEPTFVFDFPLSSRLVVCMQGQRYADSRFGPSRVAINAKVIDRASSYSSSDLDLQKYADNNNATAKDISSPGNFEVCTPSFFYQNSNSVMIFRMRNISQPSIYIEKLVIKEVL